MLFKLILFIILLISLTPIHVLTVKAISDDEVDPNKKINSIEIETTSNEANKNNITQNNSCITDFNKTFYNTELRSMLGFFKGTNEYSVTGKIKIGFIDNIICLKVESFNIENNNYFSDQNFRIFLTNSENRETELDMGLLEIENLKQRQVLGTNIYEIYDLVIVLDSNNEKIAEAYIRDTNYLGTSPELFVDWVTLNLFSSPFSFLPFLFFAIIFDYVRMLTKMIFFSLIDTTKKGKNNGSTPLFKQKVSILVPAHNEEYGIRESIESALMAEYPNKEIIVIDDGSTDNTYKIAKEYHDKQLIKLVHRGHASGSKSSALNYGSVYATGDLILCMDGDTLLQKDSLNKITSYFEDNDVLAISGNVKILSGDEGKKNTLTRLQQYEYFLAIELGRRFTSYFNSILVISGAFGVFRKDVFERVGKYDKDTITEDFDLTLKIKKQNGKIIFVNESIAWTYCPNNIKALYKQRKRWAFGQFQTLLKHKNIMGNTKMYGKKFSLVIFDMWLMDFIMNLFFIAYVIVLSISLIMEWISYFDLLNLIIFVIIVYIFAEFILYFLAYSKSNNKEPFKLILLAPVMSLAYRPFLRITTFLAHLNAIFGSSIKW